MLYLINVIILKIGKVTVEVCYSIRLKLFHLTVFVIVIMHAYDEAPLSLHVSMECPMETMISYMPIYL